MLSGGCYACTWEGVSGAVTGDMGAAVADVHALATLGLAACACAGLPGR